MADSGTKFIRVRGRVVPIKGKGGPAKPPKTKSSNPNKKRKAIGRVQKAGFKLGAASGLGLTLAMGRGGLLRNVVIGGALGLAAGTVQGHRLWKKKKLGNTGV